MAELKADVLVLGAGMVGVSAALHLQKRGRDVILLGARKGAELESQYSDERHCGAEQRRECKVPHDPSASSVAMPPRNAVPLRAP